MSQSESDLDLSAAIANHLQSASEAKDDDPSLNVLAVDIHGGSAGPDKSNPFYKVPLSESANYLRLHAAKDGLTSGRMSHDQILEELAQVQKITGYALRMHSTPAAQKALAKFSKEDAAHAQDLLLFIVRIHEGVDQMKDALTANDRELFMAGYYEATQAFEEMDVFQDKVIAEGEAEMAAKNAAPETDA